MQRPQTTILNLLDFARDIGLGEALLSPQMVRAMTASNRALYDDGRLTPDALKNLDWREREWYFPNAVPTGSGVGARKPVPQGGVLRLITISANVPPSSGTCTFRVHAGGASETISLPQGASSTASSNVNIAVVPGGVLTIDGLSDGGASGVTVTAFLSQGGA